jgi:hypothetical protein
LQIEQLLATPETISQHSSLLRKQLFGNAPTGCYGFTSPTDDDVPLRGWITEHLGEEALV